MSAVQQHSVHRVPHKTEVLARMRSERKLQTIRSEFRIRLTGKNLTLLPEYGLKLNILKHLAFVSETEVAPSSLF
jgi:hypothetical protein